MSKFSRKDIKKYILKLKDIFTAPDIEQARERKEKLVKELEPVQRKNSIREINLL